MLSVGGPLSNGFQPILKKPLRHLLGNRDVLGLGLPSDDNFQPITSFVSLEMLGNEIVVGVRWLGYGGKHVTSLRVYPF